MGTVVVRVWVLKRRVSSRPLIEPVICTSVTTMSVDLVIAIRSAATDVAAFTTRYPYARNVRAYRSC